MGSGKDALFSLWKCFWAFLASHAVCVVHKRSSEKCIFRILLLLILSTPAPLMAIGGCSVLNNNLFGPPRRDQLLIGGRPTTGVRWDNLMVGHQGQEREAAYTPYTPLWGPVFSVMDSEVLMPAHIFCGPLWLKVKCQVTHRGLNSQLSHLCAMIKYLQLCLC